MTTSARSTTRFLLAASAMLTLAGCTAGGIGAGSGSAPNTGNTFSRLFTGSGPRLGQAGFVRGFLGGAVADEPRAALVARDVLSAGGSAVDAAVAGGFAMSVLLPSRAGLGGGGACLVFNPSRGQTESIVFPAGARGALPGGTDRPAALPMVARGLFLLHTRGGTLRFEQVIRPAEDLARTGTEVSRALAQDIAVVHRPLLADPAARAVFARPDGQPLQEGDRLVQPDLGGTLSQMRNGGVGELYQGQLARRLVEASIPAGGGLVFEELRAALPRSGPASAVRSGNDLVSFPDVEADGGATSAAFQASGGGYGSGNVGAQAGLLTIDRTGMAVACAFSMNNLFGTGRIARGTGIVLGAAPGGHIVSSPLAVALAQNANLRSFRASVAGSGQAAAPAAAGGTMAQLLRGQSAANAITAGATSGRALAITCPRYLPGAPQLCEAASDPRGAGVAFGSVAR